MKKALKTAVFALCTAIFAQGATVPVQDMTAFSLGAEYYGSLNGHSAMYDFDTSALAAHVLRLHYAPLPFVRFSAGIGGSHQYGEDLKGAEMGLAATGGAALYLPKLLNFLSLTGGYDGYYLKASQEVRTMSTTADQPTVPGTPGIGDQPGVNAPSAADPVTYEAYALTGKTAAFLHVPYIGAIFHLGRFVDIEAGGLYRYFTVEEKSARVTTRTGPDAEPTERTVRWDDVVENDKTSKQFRVYGTLTLHERESGAYLTGGASYAPVVESNEKDRGYLVRFSAHVQIGLIMRDPRGGASKKAGGEYSESYSDLKSRQEGMAEALQRDIERDRERNREEGRDEDDFSEGESE